MEKFREFTTKRMVEFYDVSYCDQLRESAEALVRQKSTPKKVLKILKELLAIMKDECPDLSEQTKKD